MRLWIAICLTLLSSPLFAQVKPEDAGQKAAEQWLALVDAGKFEASWEQAATFFKAQVTKDTWVQQVSAVRSQTGKLKSRKLKSAQYTEQLPTAPAGKYVVLQYDSTFDGGSMVETVVPMADKDGTWKVSGYFVKAGQ